jgi:hypothetical protein
MVALSARYVGGGKSLFGGTDLPSVTKRIKAVGIHRAEYDLQSGLNRCGPFDVHLPKPDLQANQSDVFSGRTVRGNVCFEIASNDATTLRLYVEPPTSFSGKTGNGVWFALR